MHAARRLSDLTILSACAFVCDSASSLSQGVEERKEQRGKRKEAPRACGAAALYCARARAAEPRQAGLGRRWRSLARGGQGLAPEWGGEATTSAIQPPWSRSRKPPSVHFVAQLCFRRRNEDGWKTVLPLLGAQMA